jgi:hypothetical protein
MAVDPRRFDDLAKVVSDSRRHILDMQSTVLSRMSSHTHGPTGIISGTLYEARYTQTSSQSFVTSTDTKIQFNNAIYTCPDVTVSGTGNTDFNLVRAGLWRISTALRYLGNSGSGERHIFPQTGSSFNTANRITSETAVNVGSVPCTVCTSTEFRVTANTVVIVGGWQNCGATLTTDVGFGGTSHIALTWLRP